MKRVTIMRGCPGSGKTTRARVLAQAAMAAGQTTVTVSADHFFERDGRQFDASKLKQAHSECFSRFLEALEGGIDHVIVDNTNTRVWEFLDFVKEATLAGYDVTIDQVTAVNDDQLVEWHGRCVHGVPLKTIRRMHGRWERFGELELKEAMARWAR